MKRMLINFLKDVFTDIQPVNLVDRNGLVIDGYSYSHSDSLFEVVREAHSYFGLSEFEFVVVGY